MNDESIPPGPAAPSGNAPSPAKADTPHGPADDQEVVYFEGSPLLRGFSGHVIAYMSVALVLFVLPFFLHWLMSAWPSGWIVAISWLAAVVVGAWPFFLVRTVRYRISNYRIDYECGIFSKNIDTLELWHVDDVSFHQSLSDRLLNVGTITVMSGDKTTPQLKLRGLPDPRPLFNSLKQQVISVKRQRGVIKMDIG